MKVFVTGVSGQLGHDVVNELHRQGIEAVGSDIHPVYGGLQDGSYVTEAPYVQMDITDEEAVRWTLLDIRPDAVIHCAAWTAVDAAEEEENKPKVYAINVTGTKNIAMMCGKLDIKMLLLSTDYVFDGQGDAPWEPDSNAYAPICYYGETKLLSEAEVKKAVVKYFIVRIAWVFGVNGSNFVKTMLRVGRSHPEVRVVNDQIGTPTYTFDLAKLLVSMIQTEKYGFYHATNEGGFISWYDFTKEIYRETGLETKVTAVTTAEYGLSKAKRPFNSRLSKEKLSDNGFLRLPPWQDALHRYLIEIGEIKS